jgi:hypothetical protein
VDQIDSSHYKFFSVPSYVFESKGLCDPLWRKWVGLTTPRKREQYIILAKRADEWRTGEVRRVTALWQSWRQWRL